MPRDFPWTLDIVINSLVFAFVVTGVGYLGAILLVDTYSSSEEARHD